MIHVTYPGGVKVQAHLADFDITTDQPVKAGGEASAPTPFMLFLASLATCAGYYVKAFCDSRKISTEGITLSMDTETDPVEKMLGMIVIRIHVPADFPEKYDQAVINAAATCAVKRHLSEKIHNEILVVRNH
ncbi:MAG TPA: OsmC family protein [Bacteroidales bacterium]|nr:OsmC family protein [Bacteroidales bacterium]HPS73637.1 OsmC family protein [Bacteroidales bacterium]